MQFPKLFVFEVEARPMLAARRTGVWLTYRVVAPDENQATPKEVIDHAVAYFKCGVTLTVSKHAPALDALVIHGGPAEGTEVGERAESQGTFVGS